MLIIISLLLISTKIYKDIIFNDKFITNEEGNDNRLIYYPKLYIKKKDIYKSNSFINKYTLLNKLLNPNISSIKKKELIKDNSYIINDLKDNSYDIFDSKDNSTDKLKNNSYSILDDSIYNDWNFIF